MRNLFVVVDLLTHSEILSPVFGSEWAAVAFARRVLAAGAPNVRVMRGGVKVWESGKAEG